MSGHIEFLIHQADLALEQGPDAYPEVVERIRHGFKRYARDWRNHFTPDIKHRFKKLHGELLIRMGYAGSLAW
ncbi:MAG: hypothetical protein HQL53_10165 [Magnetococcales bacterium]|nr:hypothetical protein [Magnetococcales bacterium]